jgi:hypothetical protein
VPILFLFGLTVCLLLVCMQTRVRDTCLFRHAVCAHHALPSTCAHPKCDH